MTKKDYDLIAACIGASQANLPDEYMQKGIQDLTSRLELELELDNPKFDINKFRDRIDYWMAQHVKE